MQEGDDLLDVVSPEQLIGVLPETMLDMGGLPGTLPDSFEAACAADSDSLEGGEVSRAIYTLFLLFLFPFR